MKKWFIILLVSMTFQNVNAQFGYQKMVGVNVMGMASQFIPFTDRLEKTGPFQLIFRSGNDGKMFNFKFGAGKENVFEESYVNILMGYLRMREIGEKFYYYSSINAMYSTGRFNIPGEEERVDFFFEFQDARPSINLEWGFGYYITPRISICTESQLIVSFGDNSSYEFIPPIGLFIVASLN